MAILTMREEEFQEIEAAKQVNASDRLLYLLQRNYPEHDIAGIDDVKQETVKKRIWPEELR